MPAGRVIQGVYGVVSNKKSGASNMMAARLPSNPSTGSFAFHLSEA